MEKIMGTGRQLFFCFFSVFHVLCSVLCPRCTSQKNMKNVHSFIRIFARGVVKRIQYTYSTLYRSCSWPGLREMLRFFSQEIIFLQQYKVLWKTTFWMKKKNYNTLPNLVIRFSYKKSLNKALVQYVNGNPGNLCTTVYNNGDSNRTHIFLSLIFRNSVQIQCQHPIKRVPSANVLLKSQCHKKVKTSFLKGQCHKKVQTSF